MVSATFRNASFGVPQTFSTISGVYLAKWRLRTWKTQRSCSSVGSVGRGSPSFGADSPPTSSPIEAALAPPDGGVVYGRALVAPARRVVLPVLLVPAGEQARGVRVLELLGDEGGGVGVVDDVVPEVPSRSG